MKIKINGFEVEGSIEEIKQIIGLGKDTTEQIKQKDVVEDYGERFSEMQKKVLQVGRISPEEKRNRIRTAARYAIQNNVSLVRDKKGYLIKGGK